MRIGFDVSQTGRWKTGCGYFADSLIQELARLDSTDEFILYPTFGPDVWDDDWPTLTRTLDEPNVQRGLGHRSLAELESFWQSPPANLEALLGAPDIVHANNFYCPRGLQAARLVYTLYDLGFLEHPEWTTEANRMTCFHGVFQASLSADHIIAISQYTRAHFLRTFPHVAPERVSVVYPASRFDGPAPLARPAALAQLRPGEFWLSVGTLEPRKNHRRLLEAYARLCREPGAPAFPLVLAGARGWLMEDFDRFLVEFGIAGNVVQLGYIDDLSLRWLYQNCFAACYVSLFEGFGLPVVEAMSLGAPVLASNASSLPEVAGSAGVLVEPTSVDAIFQGMLQLASAQVDRTALGQASLDTARQFSWRAAAAQVAEIYQQLAGRPAASPAHTERAVVG